ncbi:MAG: MFS transporter [Ectothiorhodospiraceae bacterium]|nr:MFS transporter [Ectothiorhodospiraceae bacterium]
MTPTGLTSTAVATLVLLVGAFASVPFLLSPLLPDIALTFGLSTAESAWAVSLFGATLAIAAPLFGLFGGRFPRLRLIRIGLALFTLGLVGAALAPGFAWLLLALAATGVGAGMYVPTAYSLVGDHVPFAQRGRTMGRVMAGWGYAIIVCIPLGGYLADLAGWRSAMALLAAVATLALLASRLLPAGRAQATGHQPPADLRQLSAAVFLDPGARLILLVNVCNMVAFYGAYTYLGTWLRNGMGMGSDGAGLVILAYGAGLALMTLNSRLLDRLGHRQSLYLAHGGLMVGWLALALSPGPGWAMLALLWIGIVQGAALVGQSTLCSHQSDHGRGAIMAFFTCTTYIGVFAGAALFGPVFSTQGYLTVALLAAALNGVASLLLHLGRHRLRAA